MVTSSLVSSLWSVSFFPDAREAGGSITSLRGRSSPAWEFGPDGLLGPKVVDPQRSAVEAARRARVRARRYSAANRLDRLGTLTYRGAGCFDYDQMIQDVHGFIVRLRAALGGKPFPYVWVPEWHKDHGLHVHFGLSGFVHYSLIDAAWGLGRTNIKRLTNLPAGSGPLAAARINGRYLAKYVGKAFDDRRIPGRHRYEVGRGFEPRKEIVTGFRVEHVLDELSERVGAQPQFVWQSYETEGWQGPPSVFASWPA
ncbi:MAG TPA: hypothetical protein VGL75_09100 [Acidothermaceae bacterium]